MSAKPIKELQGKKLLTRWIKELSNGKYVIDSRRVGIYSSSVANNPIEAASKSGDEWLATEKLVVKPDQLIKRRGKSGLLKLNATIEEADAWLKERRGKEVCAQLQFSIVFTGYKTYLFFHLG
jgi:ATP citrate (pro-S)-lyase